jgi:uncharacterized protein (TIGR03083 family)
MPTDATAEADRWIRALRLEQDQLADRVRAMSPQELEGPSASTEWSIAQVLSHLGSGAEIMYAGLDATLRGQDRPGDDFAPSVWARWNALDAAGQAAGFLDWSERMVATLEGLDDDDRANLRVDLGFLPEPADVATLTGLRLNELTLHAWDVRVMDDPATELTPTSAELLIDRTGMLIGFIGHAEAIEARPVSVSVLTHGPDRSLGLELADRVSVTDAPDDPGAVLDLPAEAFQRLVAGRLKPEHTPASVEVSGPAVTLDDLRRVFPGY